MTYQTDEEHLPIFPEYFVGVVKLACYSLNTCLPDIEKLVKCYVYEFWATQACTIPARVAIQREGYM
jgi:hypothetical protein